MANLSSGSITNLDATPPVRSSAGAAGAGYVMAVGDYVTPGTADTSGVYRLLRVPSTANVRRLWLEVSVHTATTLTGDLTIYYSDSASDEEGASEGDSGLVNSLSGTSSLFAHALAMTTSNTITEATDLAGNFNMTKRNEPLWQAAGLSTDPGGFFDICFVLTTTNSVAAGTILSIDAELCVAFR